MKTLASLILTISLLVAPAFAETADMPAALDQRLPALQQKIRNSVVQPFTLKTDGRKLFHKLENQSLVVQWEHEQKAVIETELGNFSVELTESIASDGDLYDVEVTDITTGERILTSNVFAYGDVLLGLLNGDNRGIQEVQKN